MKPDLAKGLGEASVSWRSDVERDLTKMNTVLRR
jgi:hypothetical protein